MSLIVDYDKQIGTCSFGDSKKYPVYESNGLFAVVDKDTYTLVFFAISRQHLVNMCKNFDTKFYLTFNDFTPLIKQIADVLKKYKMPFKINYNGRK